MGGGGAHAGHHVLVGGHREAGVCVAESFGHDLDRCARSGDQGGVGVAQVVESDPREIHPSELSGEELADRFGVHGFAVGVGEDRVIEPDGVAVLMLAASPCGEDVLGAVVEIDASSAGLGLAGDFETLTTD